MKNKVGDQGIYNGHYCVIESIRKIGSHWYFRLLFDDGIRCVFVRYCS